VRRRKRSTFAEILRVLTAGGRLVVSDVVCEAEPSAVLSATAEALGRIARLEAARCCQRESFISLMTAAELSRELLPIPLKAEAPLICRQSRQNEDCIKALCPVVRSSRTSK
jgi:hypothetical protein